MIPTLILGLTLAAIQLPASPTSQRPPSALRWHSTLTARLEALALLQTLNADLLSHESATLTLEHWCQAHHMASPARVLAERGPDIDKPPTDRQRMELGVGANELIRYRRVQLRCGEHILSKAENWYVPARLTSDMNRLLESTQTPFGRVVQSLHFWRHVLEARLLWSPLPAGWEQGNRPVPLSPIIWPGTQSEVLQHRAVLVLPDGRPISEVIETYTAAVLDFPQPRMEP